MDVPDLKDHAYLHIPWTNLKKLNLNQLTNSMQGTSLGVSDEKGALLPHTEITSKQLFQPSSFIISRTRLLNNNVTKRKLLQHCVNKFIVFMKHVTSKLLTGYADVDI